MRRSTLINVYIVESVYYDAVHNDIPDKTIPSHVFGWFYISCR
jgi:hypothetical protein